MRPNCMRVSFLVFCFFLSSLVCFAQNTKQQTRNQALKILLISDLNDSYGATTYSEQVHDVIAKVDAIQPDLVLCAGDMVAGQSKKLSVARLDSMWSGFLSAVLNPLSEKNIPFGFTMGNHDASPNYLHDRQAASKFWLANKGKVNLTFIDDGHFPYYFSYIKNNVFFISWDASSEVIPDQIRSWMKEQLQLAVAKNARGRIVLGHLPLYALVADKNKPGEVLQSADETLSFLKSQQVDMYISGHQHVYYPAAKEQVTLLHAGCLGGGPRELIGHQRPAYKAYAVIEIGKRKRVRKADIQGFVARDHREVPLDSLPARVQGFNGIVERIDVAQNP